MMLRLSITIVCFILGLLNLLPGQSNIQLYGMVLDSLTGAPVDGAEIQIAQTSFTAFSKADGQFFIENLPPGEYQILVSRLGYRTVRLEGVRIHDGVTTRVVISLAPIELRLPEIVVQESSRIERGETPATIVFNREQISAYREAGIVNLLHLVPGLQLESPDGGIFQLRLRIHGSKANQVLVLLDGQRLNNPQTGEVDLSLIDLEAIERIEVIPHGYSARYGNQAYAGVVAFYSRKVPKGISATAGGKGGSFRTAAGNIGGMVRRGGVAFMANYQQAYALQNYPYGYQGNVWIRENAWSRYHKVFIKSTLQIFRHRVQLLFQRRDGKRGLPSPYFNEYRNFGALSSEQWQMGQIQYQWYWRNHWMLHLRIGIQNLVQQFDNRRDPSPFTRYFTENWNQTAEAEAWIQYVHGHGKEITFGMQGGDERLKQQNLLYPRYNIGLKIRQSRAIYWNSRWQWSVPSLFKSLQLHATYRYEKYFDLKGEGYPYFALAAVPAKVPALSISAGWQKAIRYPDFNSLFWKGDARARGNPNLLPERKQGWFLNLQWNGQFITVNNRFYQERLSDLIYWHRGVNGIWEPRNLRSAFQQGVDLAFTYHFWQQRGNVQVAYSWIKAINTTPEPNTYLKRIIFIPPHTLNTSLTFRWSSLVTILAFRYVGERQTVPANSPQTQLQPYKIWDAMLRYQWQWKEIHMQVGVTFLNILNEDYQLIFGYPMPRRAWYFHLNVNWKHHH